MTFPWWALILAYLAGAASVLAVVIWLSWKADRDIYWSRWHDGEAPSSGE